MITDSDIAAISRASGIPEQKIRKHLERYPLGKDDHDPILEAAMIEFIEAWEDGARLTLDEMLRGNRHLTAEQRGEFARFFAEFVEMEAAVARLEAVE